LTFTLLRTEHTRNLFAEIMRNDLETRIINFISDSQNLTSEEEKDYAEYVKKNGFKDFTFTIPKELIISLTFNPDIIAAVFKSIYQMNLMLLEAPKDYSFILGDTAIIRLVPPQTLLGFSNQNLILAMPLSSKLLLLADWNNKENKRVIMYPEYVEKINALSILWSSQMVFFNEEQYDMIQLLIQKCSKDKIVFNYNDLVSASAVTVERK
jgi:hypothetical protein